MNRHLHAPPFWNADGFGTLRPDFWLIAWTLTKHTISTTVEPESVLQGLAQGHPTEPDSPDN
jgi:hypothetical protein